jgi:hypothetical protein
MQCHCCGVKLEEARKAKIRPVAGDSILEDDQLGQQALTYRWGFLCQACYKALDNEYGTSLFQGTRVTMAGESRAGKAATVTEAKYRKFLEREMRQLGDQLSSWLAHDGGNAVKVARAIAAASGKEFAVLADSLMDAGCDNEELLLRLRVAGRFYQACWTVDLLLLAAESLPQAP